MPDDNVLPEWRGTLEEHEHRRRRDDERLDRSCRHVCDLCHVRVLRDQIQGQSGGLLGGLVKGRKLHVIKLKIRPLLHCVMIEVLIEFPGIKPRDDLLGFCAAFSGSSGVSSSFDSSFLFFVNDGV